MEFTKVCLAGWLAVCMNLCIDVSIYACMKMRLSQFWRYSRFGNGTCPALHNLSISLDTVELLWLSSFGRDSHAAGDTTGRANSNLRALRLLRVGRLFRVVRIIRVVKFFRSLRTLVHSLVGTLRSLFWALLLLFLVTHVLAQLSVPRGRSQYMQGTIGICSG